MIIKKQIKVILETKDLDSLAILLEHCQIEDCVRNPHMYPSYFPYQLKAAYELFEKLRDL